MLAMTLVANKMDWIATIILDLPTNEFNQLDGNKPKEWNVLCL